MQRLLRFLPQPSLQEKVDVYRAALLLKCFDVAVDAPSRVPSEEAVERIHTEVDELSHDKRVELVQQAINKQTVALFQRLEQLADEYAYGSLQQRAPTWPSVPLTSAEEKLSAGMDCVSPSVDLIKTIGFGLQYKPSRIAGAGGGLFLRTIQCLKTIEETNTPSSSISSSISSRVSSHVRSLAADSAQIVPGTVLAYYPGLVHLKEHLRDPAYVANLLPDEDLMLMSRFDETLIDARTAPSIPQLELNPFAMGHRINHCGAGKRPNVMPVAFDFLQKYFFLPGFPEELRRYIPNRFATAPSVLGQMELGMSCFMKTVVLVSTQHIGDDEELLMDYRLSTQSANDAAADESTATTTNSSSSSDSSSSTSSTSSSMSGLPAWYSVYDEEEAANRWNGKSSYFP